ncbi:fibronectin type III domain-containing protein, partial [Candidatus Roizmanbacteria bacterium]|nr:fibronectin type III domain-containing protein [Candidatus Roizmanbacteria bacterium]
MLFSLIFLTAPLARAQDPALPSPTTITVESADTTATLQWGTTDLTLRPEEGKGVQGYYVEWGKVGAGFPQKVLTEHSIITLGPLEKWNTYQARVSAVDKNGALSPPSTIISFATDESRTASLSAQMNGFFDNFNTLSTRFDQLKWNTASSACVAAGKGSQTVVNFTATSRLSADDCDNGQIVARPRQIFDFTNRTGTVTFDLDGAQDKGEWSLDLLPAPGYAAIPRDITGHGATTAQDEDTAADPAYTLRLSQSNNKVTVSYYDKYGVRQKLPDATAEVCKDLHACVDTIGRTYDLTPVPGILRHWKVQISRTHLTAFINEIKVADVNIALPFERSFILWTVSTNSQNPSEIHWDNFGFDAPPGFSPATITHNYLSEQPGKNTEETNATLDLPYITTVNIPDQIRDTYGQNPT